MAVPQNFFSVGTVPSYFIYRDVVPGAPFDPTSPPQFYPPKDSDELFDALRLKYPHVPNHADRMRDAIIEFLLEERAAESLQTSPALTVDPSTVSWTSASSGTMSSFFNSPDDFTMPTPTSLNQSPLPEAPIGDHSAFAQGSVDRSPQTLDAMTGVFSVSSGAQPKQRTRRKMTEAEKVDYRNRRIAKACDKCAKRKRKCQHGETANAPATAPASTCHKVVKAAQAGVKQTRMTASMQVIPSALPEQGHLLGMEDFGSADLFDITMLGDLDVKPEDFVFDAFVHDSTYANFSDQNFQAITNSGSPVLQEVVPHRPRTPSIMVEDFELYSPPRDCEDAWATSTNSTSLNFGSLTGGQQSAGHSSLSQPSQQNTGQAVKSRMISQSTNAATIADTTALFDAHQPQSALAQLTRARRCQQLGNNLPSSAATIDSPVVSTRNPCQQTIAPGMPHDAQGYSIFTTDANAGNMSIFAAGNARGMTTPSDISTIRPDSTSNCNDHQFATQAANALLASTTFAGIEHEPSGSQTVALQPLSRTTGRHTYADLQQHSVQDQPSQIAAFQNVGANLLVEPELRRSHAMPSRTPTDIDVAAFMSTASYGFASQPSYLQRGGRGVSHAEPSSMAAHIQETRTPFSSGPQGQQDDGHWSAADLGISRHDLTDQFASAKRREKSLINSNVAGAQLSARSQQVKDESVSCATLLPQSLSLVTCFLFVVAFLLMPLGVDKVLTLVFILASFISHAHGLFPKQTGISLDDDQSSTSEFLSCSSTWAVSSVLRPRTRSTLRSLSKATSAQMSLLACATGRLHIGTMM
jgi:hypothetical protein